MCFTWDRSWFASHWGSHLTDQATMLRRSSLRRLMTRTPITTGRLLMTDRISPTQFRESEGVEDWRVLGDGANAYFRTGSYAAGARLVQAISELPGTGGLLPDVDVRHDRVTVRMVAFLEASGGVPCGRSSAARRTPAARPTT